MPERYSVRVPATSANVGCGLDCAALALNLYLDIHVATRNDSLVRVSYRGETPERVPLDESNLIARTIQETLSGWSMSRGFDLDIENQIPVGVGLGSSAAAIVGALTAAHWLADTSLPDEELISLATRIEGHPDNVAAAWLGGFIVALQEGDRVHAYSSPVPDWLQVVLVVPNYALPTEKAREVLPGHYPRADAVHNLQRAAVLAAQIFSGKIDFHPHFFDDRWHQPCRASLVPGLAEVLALRHPDLLGVCLSGAGPSVLAFVRSGTEAVGAEIQRILLEKGIRAKSYVLAVDNLGAKGWSLPA